MKMDFQKLRIRNIQTTELIHTGGEQIYEQLPRRSNLFSVLSKAEIMFGNVILHHVTVFSSLTAHFASYLLVAFI